MPWLERFREWGRSRCWVDTKRYELKGSLWGVRDRFAKGVSLWICSVWGELRSPESIGSGDALASLSTIFSITVVEEVH
jgi:hypothetical protein